MNQELVDRIAAAVLYEGYILYPYRPAVKNRQRWTFGGLYPEAYCQARANGDAASSQTECLVAGSPATTVEASVRFLHLTARVVGEVIPPRVDWQNDSAPPFRPVETLQVGDRLFHSWQEAEEREVALGEMMLGELLSGPRRQPFAFPGGQRTELLRGSVGEVVGVLLRRQQPIEGAIEVGATLASEGLFRLTLRVVNGTPLEEAGAISRDDAVLRSLASTHSVLAVRAGEFVSLLDPPACWREAAAGCRNIGVWPVLVGAEGEKHTLLASPIILYDYPQLAPESPGAFFDSTEIDEMLTLRIMTLTDEEKSAMADVDDRTRTLLARTEALAREQLLGLHGTVRGLRYVAEENEHG